MTSITKITLACLALLATSGVFAQKAGDNVVNLGLALIHPNTQLASVTTTSTSAASATAFTASLKDATAHVDSHTFASFSWLHMYSNNMGAEVTIGIPKEFTLDLTTPNGTVKNHDGAVKLKILTPAVVAKYFFGTTQDQWRPYLGLGVSHVAFSGVRVNAADSTVQALAGTTAESSSSWTPIYNAGLIYNLDDTWSVSGAVSYLPIKTAVTFVGPGLGVPITSTADVKLNSTSYVLRVGYRF